MFLGTFFSLFTWLDSYIQLWISMNIFFYALDVCPSPPRLVHGSHDGNDFSNGRNVTYSCDPLYELEGSEVMTCLDGQWLGQIPVCRGN